MASSTKTEEQAVGRIVARRLVKPHEQGGASVPYVIFTVEGEQGAQTHAGVNARGKLYLDCSEISIASYCYCEVYEAARDTRHYYRRGRYEASTYPKIRRAA